MSSAAHDDDDKLILCLEEHYFRESRAPPKVQSKNPGPLSLAPLGLPLTTVALTRIERYYAS